MTMKVLWFAGGAASHSPEQNKNKSRFQASGWVSQLRSEMLRRDDIELGICFDGNGVEESFAEYGVKYYTYVAHIRNLKNKLYDLFHPNDEKHDKVFWPHYINRFKDVINDYKPDVIEVFGSEVYLQLSAIAAKELNVPCVLHIQGILSLCEYIVLPPGMSKWSYVFSASSLKGAYSNYQVLSAWKKSVYREKAILASVPHVIGRTEWDKQGAAMLAPQAVYHYGGEMLKPAYYESAERTLPNKPIIISTISAPSYKGLDVVLKTADILKNQLELDFEWRVFGNVNLKLAEKITNLKHDDLNVVLKGVATAEVLKEELLHCTAYCHPSYIENSPNSVCEPQLLGIPVVASNVGGTSSLVEHDKTGFLFPVTDPYTAAYHIWQLMIDRERNEVIGKQAKEVASKRHNLKDIADQLVCVYKKMLEIHE